MKKICLLLLLPLGLFAQVASFTEDISKLKYANTITIKDLQKYLTVLASDSSICIGIVIKCWPSF